MSSDLLQQALVDAQALKEAAMKNAQNALIEKYSSEFNQVVQKLLEQEDTAAAPPAPDMQAAPPAPAAPPADPAASEDPAAAVDPMAVDPMADMGGLDAGSSEQNKAFDKVPGAFEGVDDEELITINFDQLKTTLNEMLGIKIKNEANDGGGEQEFPVSDAVGPGSEGEPTLTVKVVGSKNDVVSNDDELELELEDDIGGSDELGGLEGLEEIELDEQTPAPIDQATIMQQSRVANAEKKVADEKGALAKSQENAVKKELERQKAAALAQTGVSLEEELELTEEEIQALEEELKVDLDVGNMSDGYMGSTTTQKREQRNVELAAARDEKAKKERDEEEQKMADLMKENNDLKKSNDETYNAVLSLKEQLKKMSVLNAKLLYTNKALANVSLNERQKSNIVESLSKADSVLAAKTIYEAAENAIENVSKTKEAPQTLREAINRAATPFAVKKAVNSDPMAERLKTLAGINKKQ
jgi:hypothetical protein